MRYFVLIVIVLFALGCDDNRKKPSPASSSSAASVPPTGSVVVVVPSGGPPLPPDDMLSEPVGSASASASASAPAQPPKPKKAEAEPTAPKPAEEAKPAPTKPDEAKTESTSPKPTPPAASAAASPPSSAAASATASARPPAPPTTTPEPSRPADPDPAAGALAKRVDDYYLAQDNLVARFEQVYYIRSVGKKKKSSGVMKFKRPHRMKWSYDPPNKNVVVCDGTTVTVYEADNKQYTQQPFVNSEYAGALGFLTGDGIRKYFRFKFHRVQNFPGGKILLGIPIRPNPGYERVLFYVDEETAHIRGVLIIDVQGNRNRFEFISVSRQPIASSEFRWTPPPGVTRIAK